jgi:hypothetical protein
LEPSAASRGFRPSFCDRKRKKNLPFFSAYPEKDPGGVFVNIHLKISIKLISVDKSGI